MLSLFSFLVAASGIVLLLTLVAGVLDKDGKWTSLLRTVSVVAAKASAIFLALFVMVIANEFTLGILSFTTIGIYIACLAIIWSSGKDLLGGSKLASDLSTIAVDQASKLQNKITEKADQIKQEQESKP